MLHSPKLLLSPKARKAVVGGHVAPAALDLLLHVPRVGSPLLVFDAQAARLRVQETSFATTRRALEGLAELPAPARPAAIRMRQMSPSSYQVQAPKGGMLGAQAVAIAKQYLGIPYVWGGASPQGGFDCSGLVMYVYARLGGGSTTTPRSSSTRAPRWRRATCSPATWCFFEPTASGPGHVGMYIGGTEFIQAPHTGDVVKISSLTRALLRERVRRRGPPVLAVTRIRDSLGPAPVFQVVR